jgi:DNA-binding MarR family transcriptional regulator
MVDDIQPKDVREDALAAVEMSPEDAVRIEQVLHALPDLWQAYQRRLLKQQHFKGVTSGQIRLLSVLMHNAPCSVGTVANALNISMGAASESVDKLVELGYITRKHSKIDRRQVILDLTAEARDIAASVRQIRIGQISSVFRQMEPAERDGFIKGLHLYRDVLAQIPIAPAPVEPESEPVDRLIEAEVVASRR